MAEKIFKEIEEIPERDDEALDMLKRRLVVVAVLVMIFTALIIARLWYLQINSGEEYKERAFNNRVRIRQVAAPRGHILDRNGKEIVTNRPSFNVLLIREDSHDIDDVLKTPGRGSARGYIGTLEAYSRGGRDTSSYPCCPERGYQLGYPCLSGES